jgi:hypothetical protein
MTGSNQLLIELQQSKQPPLDELAAAMLHDPALLQAAVEGCASANEDYRYNSVRCLERVCDGGHADLLYPQWDFFFHLLDSRNAFQRSGGLWLIASLTAVDSEGRFEAMFERFFQLLNDEKVMVVRYTVQSTARVAKFKPHLQDRITALLLNIEQIYPDPDRIDLVKADVLETFASYAAASPQRAVMLKFAEGCKASSTSPKARQAAAKFLKTFG